MKTLRILFLIGLVFVFAFASLSYADVPQMINYQGKITTTTGALVDTTVGMVFSIYDNVGDATPVWAETLSVDVQKGVFSTLFGSLHPIPYPLFDGTVKYLGVKVGGDQEMTPRKPIVSTAYAFRAATVQSGGFPCEDCDERFVNVQGPDSVFSTANRAFKSIVWGTGSWSEGILGEAHNTSTGSAVGGYFYSSTSSGTGTAYGVNAEGHGSSSSAAYGVYGYAGNNGDGQAYGGYFSTSSLGTGQHHGVYAGALGASSNPTYGSRGYANNSSSGQAYGGHFTTGPHGTGIHTGVFSEGAGSSSASVYGVHGFVQNLSTGNVYAGYFRASSSGSGIKYGVYAAAHPDSGYAGYFEGNVKITDTLVVLGSKSAAVRVNNDEYRLLYCVESTENWFEDFGEAQLVSGKAVVNIEELFSQTVNTSLTYHVFLTPGGECNGLYVTNKNPYSFEVRELNSGNSSLTFSYRIVAKRKGFEDIRLAKMGGPTPEEVAAEQAKFQAEMGKERASLKQQMEAEMK
jgi:hypothetical protein